LLDLDVRDFGWWRRKAEVENARKQIAILGAQRISYWGEREEYQSAVRDLLDRIEMLEPRLWTDAEIKQNWRNCMSDLKAVLKRQKV
jgi:hypothetical protein